KSFVVEHQDVVGLRLARLTRQAQSQSHQSMPERGAPPLRGAVREDPRPIREIRVAAVALPFDRYKAKAPQQ
ncbi:hypothetical protein, partial [Pedococcus sp.]|uniref:hypothetical protein n=1 Tax=Pedococcus sp. TaxID=2860345 RepID=UPI002E107289|nr:hypothetical protein [Pedococcus sp.]